MHALLVTGGSREARASYIEKYIQNLKISLYDRIVLETEEAHISVEEVRKLIKQTHLKPFLSKDAVAIIKNANLLTHASQNALLKTLEEPPKHMHIILEADSSLQFLPTILSRCQHVYLGENIEKTQSSFASCISTITSPSESIGKRLLVIQNTISDRNAASELVHDAIYMYRKILYEYKKPDIQKDKNKYKETARILRLLMESEVFLKQYVNYLLVLDNLILKI